MSEEQGPSVSSAIDDNLAIILHLAGQQAEVCTLLGTNPHLFLGFSISFFCSLSLYEPNNGREKNK